MFLNAPSTNSRNFLGVRQGMLPLLTRYLGRSQLSRYLLVSAELGVRHENARNYRSCETRRIIHGHFNAEPPLQSRLRADTVVNEILNAKGIRRNEALVRGIPR